ncbi:hypothetical protein DM01DRAFT_1333061 [Hesseltinella vesiculosa]|uniref:Uncharacterized protein n=1 Tax=Hesseltinella vesiculosa TaxID=101127 RepID=A0A1X2GR77_9FUNG|nr:hypothetical protein DM01DRAFT_1333061 [Hesseltinella vesiculosa]
MVNISGGWVATTDTITLRHLRQSLIRVSLEMLDSYQAIGHQRQIRFLPVGQAHIYMHHDWQHLSQRFDTKALEQAKWSQLLDNLKQLQRAWHQRPHQQVLKIIHSFLTTFDPPPGCHVVVVDRHNYAQLGLKHKAIGSRQLVFECQVLTRQQQMAIVSDICQRFATIFRENASHNLGQIDTQLRRGQPLGLQQRCQQLYQQLFITTYTSSSDSSPQPSPRPSHPHLTDHPTAPAHVSSGSEIRRQSPMRSSPLEQVQMERLEQWHQEQQEHHQSSNPAGRHPIPPPIQTHPHPHRLSGLPPPEPSSPMLPIPALFQQEPSTRLTQRPLSLRPTPFVDTSSMTVLQLPLPTFIPSPWQWPDLLKSRTPYRPFLFGLIRRPKLPASMGFLARLRFLFFPDTMPLQLSTSMQDHPEQDTPALDTASPTSPEDSHTELLFDAHQAFASVSMTQLAHHFVRTSQRFYQDVLLHCNLKYQQDSAVLKEIGADLVQMYAALQLDISRLDMQRIIDILSDLAALDQPTPSAPPPAPATDGPDESEHHSQ